MTKKADNLSLRQEPQLFIMKLNGGRNMESFETKKLALIRILQILQTYSDIEHPLTQKDIAEKLEHEYGITIERKAVGRNLSLLKEAGFEIESGRKGNYMAVREFEDSELHMLIDGVLCSRYITAKHSKDLIERLCRMGGKHFRASVKHVHSVNDWGKTDNQALFYNIELVDAAIEEGKQIRYEYNKYGIDKRLHKTSTQQISPYVMLLHNQHYYLMGYSAYWGKICFHKVDHITNMEITEEKALPIREVPGYVAGIDFKILSSALPYMYTDKPERIDFLAYEGIIDQVIEWFGRDINIEKTDREEWIKISLIASPNAMVHWAMQYGDNVEIISPQSLRQTVADKFKKSLEMYK